MNEIQKLRFKTLDTIKIPYNMVLKTIDEKYNRVIAEKNMKDFIENIDTYQWIDIDEILFLIENYAFKKMLMFAIKDRELEELTNEFFKSDFINRNMLYGVNERENLSGLDDYMKCIYFCENGKYFIMKMAQIKKVEDEEVEELGYSKINEIEYYDFVKFIIDLDKGIVFMFYNDTSSIIGFDIGNKKEITCKKTSFYNLFIKGNQSSLNKYSIDEELNSYVENALDDIEDKGDDYFISKNITIIETEDPIEPKNNLRSSRKDSRHNKYRLQAIKYALKNEDHNIKMLECRVGNRTIILKNVGEIILQSPFFGMEVIEDVCKEIFPQYPLSTKSIASTGTDNK